MRRLPVVLFTENPRETVRKGVRGASGAFILLVPGSEIGLLGPVSSTFGVSVRSLSGLFGQFQRNCLENSWTGLDGVFLVAQSGNKGSSRLVLPHRWTPESGLFGFIKQFQ